MKSDYMELSFMPTRKGYELRHKQEKDIIGKFLNAEELPKFFQMLVDLKKNKHFRKQRWMIRIIRFFQTLGILCILGTAYLMVTVYMNDVKEVSQLEQAYLAFCVTVTFIFFTVFLTFLLDTCVIAKCIVQIKKAMKERISDLFPRFNYTMEMSSYQVIMIRPLVFDEGKPLILSGNDYYEYVKDHRPDSENYYKSTNPFELDPHEKNFAKMMIA